jgi:iron-sulfur cluster repair protein YtfE (RIC family)
MISESDQSGEMYGRVLEEHRALRSLLAEIEVAVTQRPAKLAPVINLLESLSEHLGNHFTLEETGDCFSQLVAQAPRMAERIAALLREHTDLHNQLIEFTGHVRHCGGTEAEWEQLATRFHTFRAALHNHEQRENELIQEVFTEDIGSKD